jgi:hypothetical protein
LPLPAYYMLSGQIAVIVPDRTYLALMSTGCCGDSAHCAVGNGIESQRQWKCEVEGLKKT